MYVFLPFVAGCRAGDDVAGGDPEQGHQGGVASGIEGYHRRENIR